MPSHSLLLFLLFGGAASRRYNEMQLDFIVYSAKGTQRKRKSELKSQVKRSCALQWVGMDNNATDKKKSSSQENQKAKMRLDEKISSVAFGRLTKIDADKNVPRIRVCVLGSAAVGKTAVVVRYLTNRFIGEYCTGKDLLYKKTIKIDGFPSQIEIADTSNASISNIFVRVEDGQALAVQNNCHFAELSAAEDVEGVELTMTALFREVRTLKSQRTAVRQKKPSLMHVTKLFSSLIGRSSGSSFSEADGEKPKLKSSSTASSLHTSDESESKVNTPTEKEVKSNKGIKKRPSFSL
ncbi:ras-like protein family member 11B isoform X2 [Daphnia magna]|uniref:ras-like protein family member 11B isoform X2 n=1 Tax=Daphnia magna TaxID=35525 RepID=UPI001E1BDC13|nr:ras-like protein family member 11B isoform X2 [Daphnia magna]